MKEKKKRKKNKMMDPKQSTSKREKARGGRSRAVKMTCRFIVPSQSAYQFDLMVKRVAGVVKVH